jgi:hypothetical protein
LFFLLFFFFFSSLPIFVPTFFATFVTTINFSSNCRRG